MEPRHRNWVGTRERRHARSRSDLATSALRSSSCDEYLDRRRTFADSPERLAGYVVAWDHTKRAHDRFSLILRSLPRALDLQEKCLRTGESCDDHFRSASAQRHRERFTQRSPASACLCAAAWPLSHTRPTRVAACLSTLELGMASNGRMAHRARTVQPLGARGTAAHRTRRLRSHSGLERSQAGESVAARSPSDRDRQLDPRSLVAARGICAAHGDCLQVPRLRGLIPCIAHRALHEHSYVNPLQLDVSALPTVHSLSVFRLRDWDWLPHLLVCYFVLGLVWFGGGFALALLFGCEPARACPPLTDGDALAMNAIRFLELAILPALGIAATGRVIANELRWRREGDPRGR